MMWSRTLSRENWKGFDLLVDALVKLSGPDEPKVHVVCLGWGGFIREEQDRIEKKGLMPLFSFASQTDEMSSAIRGVDIVIIPSRWEACPLLPMESMICGVPVIASDCIGMREVCRGSPASIFKQADSTALAECIEYSISKLATLKEDAEMFVPKAEAGFGSERTANAVQELYLATLSC